MKMKEAYEWRKPNSRVNNFNSNQGIAWRGISLFLLLLHVIFIKKVLKIHDFGFWSAYNVYNTSITMISFSLMHVLCWSNIWLGITIFTHTSFLPSTHSSQFISIKSNECAWIAPLFHQMRTQETFSVEPLTSPLHLSPTPINWLNINVYGAYKIANFIGDLPRWFHSKYLGEFLSDFACRLLHMAIHVMVQCLAISTSTKNTLAWRKLARWSTLHCAKTFHTTLTKKNHAMMF